MVPDAYIVHVTGIKGKSLTSYGDHAPALTCNLRYMLISVLLFFRSPITLVMNGAGALSRPYEKMTTCGSHAPFLRQSNASARTFLPRAPGESHGEQKAELLTQPHVTCSVLDTKVWLSENTRAGRFTTSNKHEESF